NDVRRAVLIDVERRERQSRLIGLESEFIVLTPGDVEFNPKELSTVELASIKEHSAIWFLIVVKICRNKSVLKRISKQTWTRSNL
ncbi:MAG: hypothetical protein WB561_01515, partial [Terracidiphilus sp.]